MRASKELVLSLYDLRFHRELLAGEAERLLCERLRHAGELEHHPARLDHADPALGRAFPRAHPRLGRLLREALVGKDVDPDLAAALDLAGHRDPGRLDLAVGDPAGVERLEPVVTELDGRLAARVAAAAAAMHLAELGLLRHQHRLLAVLLRLTRAALRLFPLLFRPGGGGFAGAASSLRGVPGLLELRGILDLLRRRRRVRRFGDLLRRHLDLPLDPGLLASFRRNSLLVGARLLDVVLAARTVTRARASRARTCPAAAGTASPAATGTTTLPALAAPSLPHRPEALAAAAAPAPALAGGAETLER